MIDDALSTEVRTNVVRSGVQPYRVVTPYLQVEEGAPGAVQLDHVPDLWWSAAGQGPTEEELEHAVPEAVFVAAQSEWQAEYERLAHERVDVRQRARQQLVKVAGLDADVVDYLLGEG